MAKLNGNGAGIEEGDVSVLDSFTAERLVSERGVRRLGQIADVLGIAPEVLLQVRSDANRCEPGNTSDVRAAMTHELVTAFFGIRDVHLRSTVLSLVKNLSAAA